MGKLTEGTGKFLNIKNIAIGGLAWGKIIFRDKHFIKNTGELIGGKIKIEAMSTYLKALKELIIAKILKFAEKLKDTVSKSATKNMDKGTAKRMAQLEDGMDPGKVYSDRNIKRTDRAAAIETKIDKAIDVVKDKIDGPAMPKQDLDKVLKISYDR